MELNPLNFSEKNQASTNADVTVSHFSKLSCSLRVASLTFLAHSHIALDSVRRCSHSYSVILLLSLTTRFPYPLLAEPTVLFSCRQTGKNDDFMKATLKTILSDSDVHRKLFTMARIIQLKIEKRLQSYDLRKMIIKYMICKMICKPL